MADIRALRGRIKSVGNIQKITRAMEMVATTKLRRFQDRLLGFRPYADAMVGMTRRLLGSMGDDASPGTLPLLAARPEGGRTAVVVVTSDRGLCGAYNTNVLAKAESVLDAAGDDPLLWVFGEKGYRYFLRRKREVHRSFLDSPLEKMAYGEAAQAARDLTAQFLEGGVDRVQVVSSRFVSMAKFVPEMNEWLPLQVETLAAAGEGGEEEKLGGDMILEPDAPTLFEALLPRVLEVRFWNLLQEGLTSEYASRRMSMKNATEAAEEMGGELRRIYNRARQEAITGELMDIVGGSEALRT